MQVCVVGGVAGGMEISMALNRRLKVERQASSKAATAKCRLSLLSQGETLQGHTPAARRKFLRLAKVCCYYKTSMFCWHLCCALMKQRLAS